MPVSPSGAQTFERGLRGLRLLAESTDGLTPTELAALLGIHRSMASRLLMAMHSQGFAARDPDGRYRIAATLLSLLALIRPRLREVAEPILRDLADRVGATTVLLVREGEYAVGVSVTEPSAEVPWLSYGLGHRDPITRGAGGLAVRAASPARPDEPARVTQAREAGYAISFSEVVEGAYAVAAPIMASGSDQPACVLVVSHRQELVEKAIPHVTGAARQIGRFLRGER